jgi:transposase
VRAREDCRGDLMAARLRLSNLLLRQGIVYPVGRPGPASMSCGCARSASSSLDCSWLMTPRLTAMLATVDRRDRLDPAIAAMAVDSMFTPVVTRLGCLRGVSRLTALGLAVEIGDRHRLSGPSIGAYLGLVPTVHRLSSPAASRMRLYVSRRPWGQNERNHFQLRSSSATFCSATIDGYFPSR